MDTSTFHGTEIVSAKSGRDIQIPQEGSAQGHHHGEELEAAAFEKYLPELVYSKVQCQSRDKELETIEDVVNRRGNKALKTELNQSTIHLPEFRTA